MNEQERKQFAITTLNVAENQIGVFMTEYVCH